MNSNDPVLSPMPGAEHRTIGGIEVDTVVAGAARVRRLIYPIGFRWSTHMKPIAGTDLCMHVRVGFLTRGQIHVSYADGCTLEFKAPQVVAIEPTESRGRRGRWEREFASGIPRTASFLQLRDHRFRRWSSRCFGDHVERVVFQPVRPAQNPFRRRFLRRFLSGPPFSRPESHTGPGEVWDLS